MIPIFSGVSAAGYSLCSLHIQVRAFALFSDEAVDPRRDNGKRYRAKLEHSIVESADVEFRSERLLRLFAGTHDRELAARSRSTPHSKHKSLVH
jgi:hypothetical protein